MNTTTIHHRVQFPTATADQLYRMYADGALHTEVIGYPSEINATAGTEYNVCGGYMTGKMVHSEPGALLVMTCKARNWSEESPESILVLEFGAGENGAWLQLTQSRIEASIAEEFDQGWHNWYWNAWKKHLGEAVAAN